MEQESFVDPSTAEIMNQYFVNIKVDREELPDIDSIYMQVVVAMTGQGGWPMSVFLTPDRKPFYGGTYFPPIRRYNMPSFKEVLRTIARLWQEERQQLLESGQHMTQHLQQRHSTLGEQEILDGKKLSQVIETLAQSYDWNDGGWGKAPKFPQPMTIEFLHRRAKYGDQRAMDMANHALKMMAKGGIYDVVGGGFARYSVDHQWKILHFDKFGINNSDIANHRFV
jgi:uncharacterized protein YyaL (SSP411 family)